MSQDLGVRQDLGVSLSSNHPENKWGAQHPAWHIRRLAKEREVEGFSLNYMLLYTEIMKKKRWILTACSYQNDFTLALI